ncbi:hypothetical protein CR513_00343, partial [Mucuna pruriens]
MRLYHPSEGYKRPQGEELEAKNSTVEPIENKLDENGKVVKTRPVTDESLCEEFSKMMQKEFEMIMMGELKFFLGLQVKQKQRQQKTMKIGCRMNRAFADTQLEESVSVIPTRGRLVPAKVT